MKYKCYEVTRRRPKYNFYIISFYLIFITTESNNKLMITQAKV